MDGRGGCCIARYGGGGAAVCDLSKVDQIMLKYRPIAPKPAASGEVSKAAEKIDTSRSRTGRGRKRRSSASSKSKSSSSSGEVNSKRCRKRKSPECKTMVTLPLLPETPDLTEKKTPVMLSFDGSSSEPAVTWPTRQNRVVGSWVIVERVTDTWGVHEMPATSDEEKRRVLEDDTCPGFVSDCWNRVWWTNKAYKEMAREKAAIGESETTSSVAVWLVMKEKLPVNCDGFTCRVTVQSTSNQVSSRMTLPCDVWRLSDGGFAWRLDVQAALSLSL